MDKARGTYRELCDQVEELGLTELPDIHNTSTNTDTASRTYSLHQSVCGPRVGHHTSCQADYLQYV
jgi:hypothetical protein